MLPEYPEFKSLESEDKNSVSRYLEKNPKKICEMALANLFIWKDFDHPELTLINDNLCLLMSPPNESPYFLEPIGNFKISETVAACLKHTGRISRASENFISLLPPRKYNIHCLRKHFDYVYSTKVLAELKGRKFDGKRNHIKKFKKRYPEYKFVPLELKFKKEAIDLFEAWFSIRKESSFFPKSAQKQIIERTFSYFDHLNFTGGAILIKTELKGFILGSPLNPEMITIHFFYGHPALRGISQTLLWEACNKIFSSFKYINLEQDLGIPGLRKAKLSYHPLRLERKFEITIQKGSMKT